MFSWLTRKKLRRRRELFCFWDGSKKRKLDPLTTWRAIHGDDEFRPDVHPELAEEGDAESLAVLLRAIKRAFKVEDYNEETGKGMTEAEQIVLYTSFCWYLDGIKKNISPSVISPSSTGPTLNDSNAKTTNDTSPSGSDSPEPSSAQPTPSGSESTQRAAS